MVRFNSIFSFATSFVICVLLVGASTTPVQAASTWLPNFDPEKRVYVDPALESSSSNPLSAAVAEALANKLGALGEKHSLDVYLIAIEQGDDLSSDHKRWAPDLLHTKLWSKWKSSSKFNDHNSVVILWVRGRDNGHMSTGVRVGDGLHDKGMSRSRLAASDGPVMTAIKANMPGQPEACFVAIVENINSELDSPHSSEVDLWVAFFWVMGFAIGLYLIVCLLVWISKKSSGGSGGSSSGGDGFFIFFGGCGGSGGGCSGGCGGGGCGGGCGGGGCGS